MFCIFGEWVLNDEKNFVCVLNYGKKSAFLFFLVERWVEWVWWKFRKLLMRKLLLSCKRGMKARMSGFQAVTKVSSVTVHNQVSKLMKVPKTICC